MNTAQGAQGIVLAGRSPEDLISPCHATVDARTGAAQALIPIPVTEGRSGFSPSLALTYRSTDGNSAFGHGWTLTDVAPISIGTSECLPRYDNHDRFESPGGDGLVPALERVGTQWRARREVRGEFTVRIFRCRTEQRLRFEQWHETATGAVHWRMRDADDVVTIYGRDPSGTGRISDPMDTGRRTFAWLPEAKFDPYGNSQRFVYVRENAEGVDPARTFEHGLKHPVAFAQRYLKRILYGNTKPLSPDQPDPPDLRWLYEVVLDYGDHGDTASPRALPDRAWPMRSDPFSTFRPGFEVRTYRLCRRVLMFHHFTELGPGETLVRSTVLGHGEDPAATTLQAVQHTGFRRAPVGSADPPSASLPPLTFRYTAPHSDDVFRQPVGGTPENVPHGFDRPSHQWTDLFGEGLPGILTRTGAAWYYKRNEGGGRFGPQQTVEVHPVHPAAGRLLTDFDGDGNTDSVVLQGTHAGFCSLDRQTERWEPFRPFAALPHLEASGARVQWIDLNGDGRPDLVLSQADRFTWYPSLGQEGFGPAVDIPKPQSPGMLQAQQIAEDMELDFFFADMNGDGRLDLVRAENGRVEYWPHIGHGRFGDGVLMEGAPRFDRNEQFDPRRLHFVDLDGTHTADVLYVGRSEIRYWKNLSGNTLAEAPPLGPAPCIDNLASVRILDFLGDGTPCLVWSSPLPGEPAAIRFLRLTGGVQPRMLLSVDNGMGQEVRFTYASSSTHYLRDVRDGRDWRSKLPRHTSVVNRREVLDQVTGTRTVNRFEYHDGCFDGTRRAFLGFTLVDQFDMELRDDAPDPSSVPSCTRTWFHPGNPSWAGPAPDAYDGDPLAPVLAPEAFDDLSALSAEDFADGLRAVAGHVVRQEVYAVDRSGGRAAHPFQVTQTSYLLRLVQPAHHGEPASYDVQRREHLTSAYEQRGDDPRHRHQLTLDTDPFGNSTLEATVAYARRAPPPGAPAAQHGPVLTVTTDRFANIDAADRHELGIPIEHTEFEASGLSPGPAGVFLAGELATRLRAALADPLQHHEPFTAGAQVRHTSWERTTYWNTAGDAELGLGAVGAPTLLHHVESACFTLPFVSQVFGGRVDAALLLGDGAYAERDGYWWQPAPTLRFADAAGFRQPVEIVRADGARTTFRYDAPYHVTVVETRDALGNRALAAVDYHLIAASAVTDANDNVTEVRCDPLGVAITTTRHGRLLGPRGQQPYGHDPLSAYRVQPDETVGAVLAAPSKLIQGAQRFVAYDLGSWQSTRTPPCAVTVERENLVHDGLGGVAAVGGGRVTVSHLDGFGRTLQTKLRVDPGPAVQRGLDGRIVVNAAGRPVLAQAAERWLVSGHVSYDAKQQPVEEHEPFHSDRPGYEGDDELRRFGVSSLCVYDAVGRLTQEHLPNGSFTRTKFSAWGLELHDPNDTVQESRYRAEREALPDTDPEKQALRKAQAHAATPTVIDLEPAGREVRVTETGVGGERRVTGRTYHHHDAPATVTDPRELTAHTCAVDLRGRVLRTDSVDAGRELVLFDAFDRPVHAWDARGVHHRRAYDVLDRPTSVTAHGALGLNHLVEEIRYGEHPAVADAALRNARGRPVRHRDGAGVVTVDCYDPDGTALRSERRLRKDFREEADWAQPEVPLEEASFVTERSLDALGRVWRETLPDGSTRHVEHRADGSFRRLRMSTADGMLTDVEVLKDSRFGARGQRERVLLGNDVEVVESHDQETFLTRRIVARPTGDAGAPAFFDLSCTHDPVGNITYATDAVQEPENVTPLLRGLTVSSSQDFTYDPYYQLTTAQGRVHQALLEHDYRPNPAHPGGRKGTRHLTLNNGAAVERYTRTYSYDRAGNIERIRHRGATRSWTTDMWISGSSNRSLPAHDPAGAPVTDPEARFDAAGNLTQLAHLRHLAYDHRGQPSRAVLVERTGSGSVDDAEYYVYAADGTRVRKVLETVVAGESTETVETLYLDGCEIRRIRRGARLLLERLTSHLSDSVERIALVHRWTTDLDSRETDDTGLPRFHYQITNHLGTAVLDLDESGRLIGYEEYFPFGGSAFLAGDRLREVESREYRYCGKVRDDATGLYCFGYRYYAPWTGRWLSPDPIGPEDTLNLYTYALNNPVSLVDLDGLRTRVPERLQQWVDKWSPKDQPAAQEQVSAAAEVFSDLGFQTYVPKAGSEPSVWKADNGSTRLSWMETYDSQGRVVDVRVTIESRTTPTPVMETAIPGPPAPKAPGRGPASSAESPRQQQPAPSSESPDEPEGGGQADIATDATGATDADPSVVTAPSNAESENEAPQSPPLYGSMETGWSAEPMESSEQPDLLASEATDTEASQPQTLGGEFMAGFGEELLSGLLDMAVGYTRSLLNTFNPVAQVEEAVAALSGIRDVYREEGGGALGALGVLNSFNPASAMWRGFGEAEEAAGQAVFLVKVGDIEGARHHARESGRAVARYMRGALELGATAAGAFGMVKVKKNSLKSLKPNSLYALYDRDTGHFLKWGITDEPIPLERYSGKGGKGYYLRVIAEGSRQWVKDLETELIERIPGPLNRERGVRGRHMGPQLPPQQSFLDWARRMAPTELKWLPGPTKNPGGP